MISQNFTNLLRNHAIFILLLAFITGCNFPFSSSSMETVVAPQETQAPDSILTTEVKPSHNIERTLSLSGGILTEVAGTIYARITSEATIDATIEPPVAATMTPGSTSTIADSLSQTPDTLTTDIGGGISSDLDLTLTPISDYTSYSQGVSAWSTSYFQIKNLNLHDCGQYYAANFKIYNSGDVVLESLLIQFTDLNTSTVLLGPVVNNSPFISTDRSCNIYGSDYLSPNYSRYIGHHLGSKSLRGHTIKATIRLCSEENLAGYCGELDLEFVVP